jgi:hypothetical protein
MVTILVGCGGISTGQLKPPILWIIGLDITTSIPLEHFIQMRDAMLPAVVLSRLRSRDEVHVLPVDSHPEKHVMVTRLVKNVGMERAIVSLFDTIQSQMTRPQRYRGMTNIGGVLAYARRLHATLQATQTRAQERGTRSWRMPRLVVTVFTDGKLEGTQTQPLPGPWPEDLSVWFFGVEPAEEAALTKWAIHTIGIPEAQVTMVRFSDWETVAEKVFGQMIDRPHRDVELLERFQARTTVAQR